MGRYLFQEPLEDGFVSLFGFVFVHLHRDEPLVVFNLMFSLRVLLEKIRDGFSKVMQAKMIL